MKILLTAGGGGHFSPLLSVIQELSKSDEVLVIGRKYGLEGDSAISLEYQIAREKNIPFRFITAGRLQRKISRYTLLSFFKIPIGFFQSIKILREYGPDVVLSFGGYVSVPVVLSAFLLRIPVVIHEQTLEVGLSNKIGSLVARKICVSWPQSAKFFNKKKVVVTGNPIRKEIISANRVKTEKKVLPVIYITGGSLGSHTINMLIEGCCKRLLEKYVVYLQTGDARKFQDYERLSAHRLTLEKSLQSRYHIVKFLSPDENGKILNLSDMVVSRAGISTITELLFMGKPALLIPLSFAQKNEQMKNALLMKEIGLAEIYEQGALTPDVLYNAITVMMDKMSLYKKASANAQNMVNVKSSSEIIAVVREVVL